MQPSTGGPTNITNRSNDGTNQRLLRAPYPTSHFNRRHLRRRVLRRRRHHPLEQPLNSFTNPNISLPKPLVHLHRRPNLRPPAALRQSQPPLPPSKNHHHARRTHLRRRHRTRLGINKLRLPNLEIRPGSTNRVFRQVPQLRLNPKIMDLHNGK